MNTFLNACCNAIWYSHYSKKRRRAIVKEHIDFIVERRNFKVK